MKTFAPILIVFVSILSTCSSAKNVNDNNAALEESTPPTISDSSENILFYRSKINGANGNLFVMDEDGGNQKQIGKSGSRPDHYPNWSPDGRSIVFESYRRGGWRIWKMNADGDEAQKVMSNRSGTNTYEFDPSFSADGKTILFVSKGDIYRIGVDGTGLKQITDTPDVFEFSPQESPDGKKILFCSGGENDFALFTVDSEGSNRKNISRHLSINYAPTWSPDGKTIAFYSDRNGSFELFLMDLEGGGIKPLMNKDQTEKAGFQKAAFIHAFDNDWGAMTQYKASFSCDGSKIAFSRDVDGNREIFVVNSDGSNLKRLTNNKLHDGFPMWGKCENSEGS